MFTSGAHRGASRTALVLIQLFIFVTYIFGPAVTSATDPTPEPTESVASEPMAESDSIAGPTLTSDKGDYPPGALVTLTGTNWQSGEQVHIRVDDDQAFTWHLDTWVTAAPDGQLVIEFNLPEWFVATYTAVATGEFSGSATTQFTDGNVKVAGFFGTGVASDSYNLTFTRFSSNDCTTGANNQDPQDRTVSTSDFTVPAGNNASVSLTAAESSTGGRVFLKWTDGDDNDIVAGSTFPRTVCASYPAGADKTWRAHYVAVTPTTTTVASALDPSTYGDSVTFTATVTASPNNPNGVGTVTFKAGTTTLCATVALVGSQASCTTSTLTAGTHSISASYSGATGFAPSSGSISQSVNAKSVTVTPDSGQGKVFGSADPTLTYTLSEPVSVTGALARATGENVGDYAISLGSLASADSNYTLALSSTTVNFAISPKSVVITPTSGQNKMYGTSDPSSLGFSNDAGLSASDFTGGLDRQPGEDVGFYAIGLGTLSAGTNYSLSLSGTVTFEITQRPITVTARAGQTKVYGDLDPTLTYDITAGSLASGDSFSGALDRDAGEDVGLYAIGQGTLTAGTNYELTFVGDDFEITQRPITVTADNKTKLLGAPDPSLTYTVTSGSLVSGDSLSGDLARDSGETVGSYAIRQGTLTAGSNYQLTFVDGVLRIVYGWNGFLQPINDTAHQESLLQSKFRLGQTIPVRFNILDATGNIVQQTPNPTFTRSEWIRNCDATVTTEPLDGVSPDTDATYKFNGSHYHYNWNTKGMNKAGVYRIFAKLADGTNRYVDICLTK